MVKTRRQKILKFLQKKGRLVSLLEIYAHLKAETSIERTSIRIMLCKGLGKQFLRDPHYSGMYKAKK